MTPQPFSRSTPQRYGGNEKNMRIELVRSKLTGLSENSDENLFTPSRHPRMFKSGVQSEFRLDSR